MRPLAIAEDDRFLFDAKAADRPIRFMEKFCRHYEGVWAGQKLKLQPWQKQMVRDLYGWKHRATKRRRFTEVFLLSAKGAGKTPFMSAIGQYELFAGGEQAAHVVSMASDYQQASLTFDWAKKSIKQDEGLDGLATVTQHEIRVKNAKWTTISGAFGGQAGFRPSCVLADEAWEWPNSRLFDSVSANLFKRAEPLLIVATNAGESRATFAWSLYERARAVIEGKSERTDLLPIIFEADESMEWDTEEAARAACPSIPEVVSFESLEPKIVAAREDAGARAEYERLHLSRWIKGGASKWLDLALWDTATKFQLDPEILKTAALYVGVDLSQVDDLSAVTRVWMTPDRAYIDAHFWMPESTALEYLKSDSIPYVEWAKDRHITLTKGPTIGSAERKAIAEYIIASHKIWPVKAVCYDRYKADETIASLEGAGIVCLPIAQGYSVGPGCAELDRRIKEKSVTIANNPVFRLCAENVEAKHDDRGNFWPVKPGAKGKFAGRRSAKIDGISAVVTALTEARKHSFPKASQSFKGAVISL